MTGLVFGQSNGSVGATFLFYSFPSLALLKGNIEAENVRQVCGGPRTTDLNKNLCLPLLCLTQVRARGPGTGSEGPAQICEMQYKQIQNKLDFRQQINSVVFCFFLTRQALFYRTGVFGSR